MILTIPDLVSPEFVERAQATLLNSSYWEDGNKTASGAAASVKKNLQAVSSIGTFAPLSAEVVQAIQGNAAVQKAAFLVKMSSPVFNRYDVGMSYGLHFDSAYMAGGLRTDLSMTVFLSDDYDGGHLVIGGRQFKPPAGSAVLYPTDQLHEVTEVTRGTRLAAILWIQSAIRDEAERTALRELGDLIDWAREVAPGSREALQLGQLRSNLFRKWMD